METTHNADDNFSVDLWIDRLAQALERFQKAHESCGAEIDWKQWRVNGAGTHETVADASNSCFRELFDFHWDLRYYVTEQQKQQYGPLLDARAEVNEVLAKHPVWKPLINLPDDDPEFWIDVCQSGHQWSFLRMYCGLLARGAALGSGGFRTVSAELACLLDPEKADWSSTDGTDLSVGYHITLFHGVEVVNRHKINEHMDIVPFNDFLPYVGRTLLERVVPDIVESRAENTVCAVVWRFHWKPEFSKYGELESGNETGPVPFLDDACSFLELVSVLQSTPVTSIIGIGSRIHHTAAMLLGELGTYESFGYQFVSRHTYDPFSTPRVMEASAIGQASDLHKRRATEMYRKYAPVISRLSEAASRTGRFRDDDRILDVAIALERLYELDQGEISYKLKTRAAVFLESEDEARLKVFRDVEALYEARSAIVHHRGKRSKRSRPLLKKDGYANGFDVARQTVLKLLEYGPPEDWNRLVITGRSEAADDHA